MTLAVEMRGIRKTFPGVIANDNVNFQLSKGEIHALLGENGAGKTTLMKCLFGLYHADEGEIFINGKKIDITSPGVAIQHGIGMVHQHFMLIPTFTVAENIVLGKEPVSYAMVDIKKAVSKVKELSKKYGLDVDPYARIQNISVGMQQRVEILKALYKGAEILILDEPTAVLTPLEVKDLIFIMKSLTDKGKSIIFITHKLKEVKAISDRVTVIRRGKIVDTVLTGSSTTSELAKMMIGRELILELDKKKANPGDKILEVEGLHVQNDRGLPAVNGLDFNVRSGEILGIAGVEGNGQSELTEALSGLRKINSGKIKLKGTDITQYSTRDIIESGVSYIPEDRQGRGLILDFKLYENLILGSHYMSPYTSGINMNYKRIRKNVRKLIKEYDVRTPDEDVYAKSLSGGNQQKVIIAREFNRVHDLLIAAQPTRGLDVGAIEFIHKKILEQRDSGKAVLLISLELDEILSLSDRIAVIYEGKIVDVMMKEEATEERLGLLMAGALSKEIEEVDPGVE
jgi:general nucleoside transport system ATP-binding protein